MGNGAPAANNPPPPEKVQPGKTKPVPIGTLVPKKKISGDAAPIAAPTGSNNGFFALKEELIVNPDENTATGTNDEFKDNNGKDDAMNEMKPEKDGTEEGAPPLVSVDDTKRDEKMKELAIDAAESKCISDDPPPSSDIALSSNIKENDEKSLNNQLVASAENEHAPVNENSPTVAVEEAGEAAAAIDEHQEGYDANYYQQQEGGTYEGYEEYQGGYDQNEYGQEGYEQRQTYGNEGYDENQAYGQEGYEGNYDEIAAGEDGAYDPAAYQEGAATEYAGEYEYTEGGDPSSAVEGEGLYVDAGFQVASDPEQQARDEAEAAAVLLRQRQRLEELEKDPMLAWRVFADVGGLDFDLIESRATAAMEVLEQVWLMKRGD